MRRCRQQIIEDDGAMLLPSRPCDRLAADPIHPPGATRYELTQIRGDVPHEYVDPLARDECADAKNHHLYTKCGTCGTRFKGLEIIDAEVIE